MLRNDATDTRIVYGFFCVWWGGIEEAGKHHSGTPNLPGCPHCGNGLMQVDSPEIWWRNVETHEANGHAGYRAFVEWQKGKCFRTIQDAKAAYESKPGRTVVL